jgi:hypothetical protein
MSSEVCLGGSWRLLAACYPAGNCRVHLKLRAFSTSGLPTLRFAVTQLKCSARPEIRLLQQVAMSLSGFEKIEYVRRILCELYGWEISLANDPCSSGP